MQNYEKIKNLCRYIPNFWLNRAERVIIENNKGETRTINGERYISTNLYFAIIKWDKEHMAVSQLIESVVKEHKLDIDAKEVLEDISKTRKRTDWHEKMYWLEDSNDFLIEKKEKDRYATRILTIAAGKDSGKDIISISDASKEYGLSVGRIKKHAGIIDQTGTQKGRYVRKSEIERSKKDQSEYVEVNDIVKDLLDETPLELTKDYKKRVNLFLEDNDYFGANYQKEGLFIGGESIKKSDISKVRKAIQRFLLSLAKATDRNEHMLRNMLAERLPETKEILDYVETVMRVDSPQKVIVQLLRHAQKDVTKLEYDETLEMLINIRGESASAKKDIEGILDAAKNRRWDKDEKKWRFRYPGSVHIPPKSSGTKKARYPYRYDDYVIMAGLCFNEGYWNDHKIVDKLIESRDYANIMLYMQLHFASMWRKADYIRTKRIPLPTGFDINLAIDRMKHGKRDFDEAFEIVSLFEFESMQRKAHKNNQPLKICIPESSIKQIGLVMIINEYHRRKENDEVLMKEGAITAYGNYAGLFGEYAHVFGNAPFSNLRACHSFADTLAMTVEQKLHPGQNHISYILVSYARSHKGTLRSLPDSTRHYLQAKTDGVDLEEFLYNLFERGAFGFNLYLLLDALLEWFGEAQVSVQTQAMQLVGYSPKQVEEAIRLIDIEQVQRKGWLNEKIEGSKNKEEIITNLKIGIARMKDELEEDTAIAKACLPEAFISDFECPIKGEDEFKCIICPYSLKFRQIIYDLIEQKNKTRKMIRNDINPNKNALYQAIIDDVINPMISESVKMLSESYGGISLESMKALIKEGERLYVGF